LLWQILLNCSKRKVDAMKKLLILASFICLVQYNFAQIPGTLKWKYQHFGGLITSPAIGNDGTIYIAVDSAVIHAINPDGTRKWEFETHSPEAIFTPPVVDGDGTIYTMSDKLYALNPDKTIKWEFLSGGDGIALGSNGTIYTCQNDYWIGGKIYAINPDGSQKWLFETETAVSKPAVASDGTVYFASDKKLIALYPDKREKWIFQSKSKILSLPVIGYGGIIYIRSQDAVYAINPDGIKKWESVTGTDINSSLSIGPDGIIYGVTNEYKLYAINSDGSNKWIFQIDSSYSGSEASTPAVGNNGIIYVGLGNKLYAISSAGNKIWEFGTGGDIASSSPAIASDGSIYFRSWDGYLYAVNSASTGLADSPWPKLCGNNQNQASNYNEKCPIAKVTESTYSLNNGGQVTLDASPSYDPDGDVLDYLWRIVEKPQGSILTLSDSTSAVITVNIPSGQFVSYRFSLKVADNEDGESWMPLFVNTGKKWEFKTELGIYSSPVIGADGTVYTISDKLYAINADGTKKWDFYTRGYHLAQGFDGTIYVSNSWDDILYAINKDGTVKWEFDINRDINNLAIGPEGKIYVTSYRYNNTYLYAVNSDGTVKWKYETAENIGQPVVGSDGRIYFCSSGRLFAVNPDGKNVWDAKIAQRADYPVFDADGTIYVNAFDMLSALNPDGTIKWEFTAESEFSSTPVIGADGTIYICSEKLYAVNPDGTKKWAFTARDIFRAAPAVGSDGTIFIGSHDSLFYAINPDGTLKNSFKTGGSISSSPAIDSEGTVYFGSSDHTLYAICSESAGLADSPWPKYNKNNQNQASSYNENSPQAIIADKFHLAQLGEQITLDGSLSFDPDGNALSYLWRIAEKPAGSTIALSDSTSSVITINIPDEAYANFRISLTVTDGDDGYSSASVIISTALKWQIDLGGYNANLSPPAIAADGTIFIGADSSLYAINPDGTQRWALHTDQDVENVYAPSIAPDGTVYFGIGKKLYAVNPDGTQKWIYESSGTFSSSPTISFDGSIYIGSRMGWGWLRSGIYAFDPYGALKWEYVGGGVQPCIGSDGTIYASTLDFLGGNQSLQAINADGTFKFTFEQSGDSPAIGSDGTIYIRSDALFALNPDGSRKWKFDTGHWFKASHAIGTDGTVYAGTEDSMFYSITSTGTEKWALKLDYNLKTCPSIGLDGTIFIGAGGDGGFGKFYAINPNGIIKWQVNTSNYIASSPAIAPDGTVYIGSNDGKLTAFNSDCGGLADSPWPKFGKDNSNTSSAYNENCPVAKVAEQHFSVENGGEITLDASSSYDPDGDGLSYLWRVTEMPLEKPAILSDSTSAVTKVTIPGGYPAYYKFSLKVTDNEDGTSWTQCNLNTGKKWEFQNGDYINYSSSPAIGQDGTIYIISDTLYALNNDSSLKWKIGVQGNELAIGSSGIIYVQSSGSELSAFTPSGKLKWTFTGAADIGGHAIGLNDNIYIGFGDKLFAIDSSGTKKWEFATNTNYTSIKAPAISSEGTIYVCSGNKLFALYVNGTKEWEYETEYSISSSPVIASDGTLYIISEGRLLAVNSNGTKKWESLEIEEAYNQPSIGQNNTIYLGSANGIFAFNPNDGAVKWQFRGGRCSGSSPAVGSDGTIFIGTENYYGSRVRFYAVNPDGTEKWRFDETVWGSSSPAIGPDGIIYFTSSHSLYALHSEGGGLADSPWPKYRHDNRNSGNVSTTVPIKDNSIAIPKKFALYQNYPNPFNPKTVISYQLPKISIVELYIYNILGQKVAELVSEKQPAGMYKVEWGATGFASGVYLYRLSAQGETHNFSQSRKLILLK